MIRFCRVGFFLTALLLIANFFLPILTLKPNRILEGNDIFFYEVLSFEYKAFFVLLTLALFFLYSFKFHFYYKFIFCTFYLFFYLFTVSFIAEDILKDASSFARVSFSSGFWFCIFSLSMMLLNLVSTKSINFRFLVFFAICFGFFWFLKLGFFDHLSLMKEFYSQQDGFLENILIHIQLALGSVTMAFLIGIPFGILSHKSKFCKKIIFSSFNIFQTIPSLAVFGFLMWILTVFTDKYPYLKEIGIQGIGFAPAFIALVIYSIFPLIYNIYIGLEKVNRSITEAGKGMGMNSIQILFQIKIPLALPVILAGIRIVLIQNIGLVVVAGLIGGGGMGNYVFQGLGQNAVDLILLGVVPTIYLAFSASIFMNLLIGFFEIEK